MHLPELAFTGRLAWEPISCAILVFKIKLWIAMLWYPNTPCRNIARSTQSDKDARHLFAISLLVLERFLYLSQITVPILDIVSYPIVDHLDVTPCILGLRVFDLLCGSLYLAQVDINIWTAT